MTLQVIRMFSQQEIVILDSEQTVAMINYLDAFSDMMTKRKGLLEFLLANPAMIQTEAPTIFQRTVSVIDEHLAYFAEFSSQLKDARDNAVQLSKQPKLEVLK